MFFKGHIHKMKYIQLFLKGAFKAPENSRWIFQCILMDERNWFESSHPICFHLYVIQKTRGDDTGQEFGGGKNGWISMKAWGRFRTEAFVSYEQQIDDS